MNFRFNVKLSDKDFLEFNYFHMLKSHYGRKTYILLKTLLLVLPLVFWFAGYAIHSFSEDYPKMLIVLIPLCLILFFTAKPIMKASVKQQLNTWMKKGKKPYSTEAVMEFSDESIVETTSENHTELKYSAIDSVYVVKGEIVYLYINAGQAYMLPYASFENEKQFNNFIEFISKKTKPVKYSE
ncbi:MAG: YcxB family protein [Clostridia bacterium]|nr:YcxB family protein [Clostridia bacterium]